MDPLERSWESLCDELRDFGRHALRVGDSLDRAEGLRHALRFLGHLADTHVEFADPLRPEFRAITSATRKFYGDGTDVDYWSARIDPRHRYRIVGTRGTVPHRSVIVYRAGLTDRIAANLVDDEFGIGADGRFELQLSEQPFHGPGLRLDGRCNEVVLRQYHKDRASEVPAQARIERIGEAPGPRPPLDPAWLERALSTCGKGLGLSVRRLDALREALRARPNRLDDAESVGLTEAFYGTASNRYAIGWFDLAPHEALRVELPTIDAAYVGVQVFNRWFESLEFRDRVTSLNDAQVHRDATGTATLTVGGPPGPVDRIDTCGHREGILLVRFLETRQPVPALECRLVGRS
jgi:hypothetical protein